MRKVKVDEQVLMDLLRDAEDYLSGEHLSQRFRVSRTAIWKAISKLKSKGCDIDSLTGKGYKLIQHGDVIFPQEISRSIHTALVGRKIIYTDQCDSTNNQAREGALKNGQEGSVYITNEQTGGRGRFGRVWHNQPGKDIAMSILLRPKVSVPFVMPLSLIAGLAVCAALESLYALEISLKWPNDVLCGNKKIAGVLMETSISGECIDYLIIGIGVNCNTREYPSDLMRKATSVALESGYDCQRVDVIRRIISEMDRWYSEWLDDYRKSEDALQTDRIPSYLARYKDQCITLGQIVEVNRSGSVIRGIAKDVLPSGSLLIQTLDHQEIALSSGEVSLSGEV
jgi:BirA family transcriptional regulator, biotin operon repressor / biotin---[acetyl-CoA-carboxylase] ligase